MIVIVLPYLAAFARVVILLTFAVSTFGKLGDIPGFVNTIQEGTRVRRRVARAAAWMVMVFETIVIISMLATRTILMSGFVVAATLLLVFSAFVWTLLYRGSHASCHCFGFSRRPPTTHDLIRNAGLVCCALAGWFAVAHGRGLDGSLDPFQWIPVATLAVGFTVVIIHLKELVQVSAGTLRELRGRRP